MQNTGAKYVPAGRGRLIIVTIVVATVTGGLFYSIQKEYGFTLPKVGWMLLFAALVFVRSYLRFRDKPISRESIGPGSLSLTVLTWSFVAFFLISRSPAFFDTVMAEVWPLLLGVALSLIASLLYSVLFRNTR